MRKRRRLGAAVLGLAAFALLFGGTGRAAADPITIFNTGVNAAGTPFPDGTIGDPHYTLISVPGGTTDIRVRRAVGGFPIPPYNGDDALSAWIGPNNDAQIDGPVGNYDYRTTFNLAGLDPTTARLMGQWSTDNEGISILLNGVSTGNSIPDPTSYTSFHPFSISSGFLPGLNTLDFIVHNDGAPTALRVEFTSATAAAAVPEPSSLALLALGGLSLAGWRRRRRKRTA